MKNFFKKYALFFIILILCIITILVGYSSYVKAHSVNKNFKSLNLKNVDNLMIVAHPDDELLWGGSHLIDDNYLVVCVTCGTSKVRVDEFVRLMNETDDKYIMLGYPDKTNGERDNWDDHRENIAKDIEEIANLKDWNIIVTHNPEGEYGHQHHKMTSAITTQVVDFDKLYYFGYYHSKKKIGDFYDEMTPINDDNLAKKKKLIGIYKSQDFIQTMFDHMFPYEDWVKASDWSIEDEEGK